MQSEQIRFPPRPSRRFFAVIAAPAGQLGQMW